MAQRRPADAGLKARSRRTVLGAIALLPACGSIGGPGTVIPAPAGPVAAPRIGVGDRWRYRLLDLLSGRTLEEPTWEVTDVAPGLRLKVTGQRGGEPLEERWAEPWSAVAETQYDVRMIWQAPVPLVPFPLEPGRGMTTTTTYRLADSPRGRRWSQRLSVARWESIEVPAGRFDCVKVERLVALEHPDPNRLSATRVDTVWYAPRVGRWVRRDLRGEYASAGLGAQNPARGVAAIEDVLSLQLTRWTPASAG